MKPPLVRIVDDDASLLRALSRRLEAAGFHVEGFDSAAVFLAHEMRDPAPGCVVLDLRMPDRSGLELQEQLAACPEPLPIVFLTAYGDVPSSVLAMKRGAVDFVTKPVQGETLIEAVRRALAHDAEGRSARDQLRRLERRYAALTNRERQVFELVARGLLNKQIAYELGTSERTIKAHRQKVMQKMALDSVADLARAAGRLAAGRQREAVAARPAITAASNAAGDGAPGTRPDRPRRR